ncbi:hypothetical protein CBR_g68871, partial [Chara braunii]
RCVGASEACWRIFGFPVTQQWPPVERLPVHLEGDETVMFEEGEEEIAVDVGAGRTKLTAWMELHKELQRPGCNRLPLYADVTETHTWHKTEKRWKLRLSVGRSGAFPKIGCLQRAYPAKGDLFYLRILLGHEHSRGATSFAALRTVEHGELATFREVCQRLHLLDDDSEYGKDMETAALHYMPHQIRQCFAMLLAYGAVSDPMALFSKHWQPMCEDYVRKLMGMSVAPGILQALAVLDIHIQLLDMKTTMGGVGLAFPDPEAQRVAEELRARILLEGLLELIREELRYDRADMERQWGANYPLLRPSQKKLVDGVMSVVLNRSPLCVFGDAPAGTGKTFCINTILAGVHRHENRIALAVVSSGIASLLLPGGRTFHSRFQAPLQSDAKKAFPIRRQGELARLIRMCSLIVWDEAPMTHRAQLEALNVTLQDICQTDEPFGGKVLLLAGDFRQVLPVVRRGTRAEQIHKIVAVVGALQNAQATREHEGFAAWR